MDKEEIRRLNDCAARAIGGTLSEGYSKRRTGPTWDTWEWVGPLGINVNGVIFHPLTKDRDSRVLQCTLEIDVLFRRVGGMRVEAIGPGIPSIVEYCTDDTRTAATRVAVLRAAAKLYEYRTANGIHAQCPVFSE